VSLPPVTAKSRYLGKEDFQPHITQRGGPSWVRSPQYAAAQGSPARGAVFVSSSPFSPPLTCPVVFWTHVNFWYTVDCLVWSQAARKCSYSSSASFLSPAMDTFAACTTGGSEQSFLSHLLQVKERGSIVEHLSCLVPPEQLRSL